MSKFHRLAKRVLAGTLAALMVITCIPGDAYATEFASGEPAIETELEIPEAQAVDVEIPDEELPGESFEEETEDASLMEVWLDAAYPTREIWGKYVSELQENVEIVDGKITGTLHFVDDYEDCGETKRTHFLVLCYDSAFLDFQFESIKIYSDKGTAEEAGDLMSEESGHDGLAVIAIAPDATKIIVDAKSKKGTPIKQEYELDLTLEECGVALEAVSESETVLDMQVSDLQSGLSISDDRKITGTVKYVDAYPGFDSTGKYHFFIAVRVPEVVGPENAANYKYIKLGKDGTQAELIADETHDGTAVIAVAPEAKELKLEGETAAGTKFEQTYDLTGLEYVEAGVTLTVVPGTESVLDKQVSELQENLEISEDGKITGTVKYVDAYPGFDSTGKYHFFIAVRVPEAVGAENAANYKYIKLGKEGVQAELIADESHDGTAVIAVAPEAKEIKLEGETAKGTKFEQIYDISGLTYVKAGVSLVVVPGTESVLDKQVSELQENLEISEDGKITGTVKYVDAYPGFDSTGKYHFFIAVRVPEAVGPENAANYKYIKLGKEGTQAELIADETHDGTAVIAVAPEAKELMLEGETANGTKFEQKYDISGLKYKKLELPLEIPGSDEHVLGKYVSKLQDNIQIGTDNKFYGKLKYVDSFEGFGLTDRNHFLAVKVPEARDNYGMYEYIKVYSDKGTFDEAGNMATDSTHDGLAVISIDEAATKLYVVAKTVGGTEYKKEYSLAGLALEEAGTYLLFSVYTKDKFEGENKDLIDYLYDLGGEESVQLLDEMITLSVNGAKVNISSIDTGLNEDYLAIYYRLKNKDKFTLSVSSGGTLLYGFDFIDYGVDVYDAEFNKCSTGALKTIKNNTFTYKGTASAGKFTQVNLETCIPGYVEKASDMTVKQKATKAFDKEDWFVLATVKYGKGIEPAPPTVYCDEYPEWNIDQDYNPGTGELWIKLDKMQGITGKVHFTIVPWVPVGCYSPVSKKLTFTVLNSIDSIGTMPGCKIYKAEGKAATVPIDLEFKSIIGDPGMIVPASVKKATYEVLDEYGREVKGVTVKNGKITVAKNYVVKGDCEELNLVISAADYKDNNYSKEVSIYIISKKPVFAEVVPLKYDLNNELNYRLDSNNITMEEVREGNIYFAVRPADVPVKDSYTDEELLWAWDGIQFKVSNSAVKLTKGDCQLVNATKAVKNFTVTATINSGYKVSLKSAKYNIVYSDRTGLKLVSMEGETFSKGEVNYIYPSMSNYDGRNVEYVLDFLVCGTDKYENDILASDYSISYTNATSHKIAGDVPVPPGFYYLTFKDNTKPITVKLTDKKTKQVSTYTFEYVSYVTALSKPTLTAGKVESQVFEFKFKVPEDFEYIEDLNGASFGFTTPAYNKKAEAVVNALNLADKNYDSFSYDASKKECTISLELESTNLEKGKYTVAMQLEYGDGGQLTPVDVSIEVKAAAKVGYKPKKNGETLNLERFGKATINTTKIKNTGKIAFTSLQNVIVKGQANYFTNYFAILEDGSIALTEAAMNGAPLEEINANNRGYVGYRAYNGSNYVEGYMYVTVKVSGAGVGVAPLCEVRYGVNPSAYQENVSVDLLAKEIYATLNYYDADGWDAGTWSEDMKDGFFLGLEFFAEGTDPDTGNTIEVAKVEKGTKDKDINWIKLTNEDNYLVAYLDPFVDYEGIAVRVKNKAGKVIGDYMFSLDGVDAAYPFY